MEKTEFVERIDKLIHGIAKDIRDLHDVDEVYYKASTHYYREKEKIIGRVMLRRGEILQLIEYANGRKDAEN